MELTKECERAIKRIKGTVDCPKGFRCCTPTESGNAPPMNFYGGANLVQCLQADRMDCPISPTFCRDIVFCQCPLGRYLALKASKLA